MFSYVLKRDVTYTETIEVQIAAKTESDAMRFAAAYGNGEHVDWPHINRICHVEREKVRSELVDLKEVANPTPARRT